MKSLVITFLVSTMLCISLSLSQGTTGVASITPDHIKVGDSFTLTYNAADTTALLKEMKEITALCLVYRGSDDDPLMMETPLTQKGTTWTGSFTLTDPKATHLAVQFVSGETYDDNTHNCWTPLVYGKDDKPIMGAYYSLAQTLQNGGQIFGENKDPDKAKEMLAKELQLYPDNSDAAMMDVRWRSAEEKTPEATAQLTTTLNGLYDKLKGDEKKAYQISILYSMIGDGARSKAISDEWVAKNPKGYIALQAQLLPLYNSQNTDEAARILTNVLDSFPDMDQAQKQSLAENMVYHFTNDKKYDKAEEWLGKMSKPNSIYLNYLARNMVDDSLNLDKAASFAQQAVTLNKKIDPADKPAYMRNNEWEDGNKNKLGTSEGTYGYALLRMSKFTDAEPVLKQAYDDMKASSPDVNERYIFTLVMNKKYDDAIKTGFDVVKVLHENAKLMTDVKNAYMARDGSDKNYADFVAARRQAFGEAVQKAGDQHAAEIDKKIKTERMTKPEIDFTLNDLGGNSVSLSSLKGKVVVIDFWATWCGPCKQSFPYLQYVYENYQNNDNVKIFAVNTWERIQGAAAILNNTKNFISANQYTFPVLLDSNFVAQYGVDGIPTKFIIDKKGNIAYTAIGFEGPQMVSEMTKEIDLLLKE